MTDFDLDRLGDVWRQDPDPAEMAALKRTAETVARRARREQIADTGFAAVVSIAVLVVAVGMSMVTPIASPVPPEVWASDSASVSASTTTAPDTFTRVEFAAAVSPGRAPIQASATPSTVESALAPAPPTAATLTTNVLADVSSLPWASTDSWPAVTEAFRPT